MEPGDPNDCVTICKDSLCSCTKIFVGGVVLGLLIAAIFVLTPLIVFSISKEMTRNSVKKLESRDVRIVIQKFNMLVDDYETTKQAGIVGFTILGLVILILFAFIVILFRKAKSGNVPLNNA